jgi:ribosomal protein L16/L10AE
MGKGRGAVSTWVCNIRRGAIVVEVDNIGDLELPLIIKKVKSKLPGRFILIHRFFSS